MHHHEQSMRRAAVHEVEGIPDDDDDVDYVAELTKHANSTWVRGDVLVSVEHAGYRNVGKAMWDGHKAVKLDGSLDDYGSVSECFKVGSEFAADHWSACGIDHNRYMWVRFDDVVAKGFNEWARRALNDDDADPFYVFEFRGEKWACLIGDARECGWLRDTEDWLCPSTGIGFASYCYDDEYDTNAIEGLAGVDKSRVFMLYGFSL